MLGRGVPLIQRTGDSYKARPITIGDPLDKVAAHLLVQSVSESARIACGSFQLGNGIQGGIDILIWTVRLLLDINPTFVIFKSDCNNAFTVFAIIQSWTQLMSTFLMLHLIAILSWKIHWLPIIPISRRNSVLVYLCNVVWLKATQYRAHSSLLLNALRTIRSNHKNVYLLSFHDDDDVFSAVYNFDICMEPLWLSRNRDKCQLYDPLDFRFKRNVNIFVVKRV